MTLRKNKVKLETIKTTTKVLLKKVLNRLLNRLKKNVLKVDIKTKNNSITTVSIIFNGGDGDETEAVRSFMKGLRAFGTIKKTGGFGMSCNICGFEGGYSYTFCPSNSPKKSISISYESTVYCPH